MNLHTTNSCIAPADTEKQWARVVDPLTTLAPFFVLGCAFLISAAATPAKAQSNAPPDTANLTAVETLETALVAAIARVEPSVVAISAAQGNSGAIAAWNPADNFLLDLQNRSRQKQPATQVLGAGVIIDSGGLILTQYLTVIGKAPLQVTLSDGRNLPASLKAADPRSGLAVLEVRNKDLPVATLGNADQLRKGQFVIAIGNPQAILEDGQAGASWGTITNLSKRLGPEINFNNTPDASGGFNTSLHHLGTLIQTDAKLGFAFGGGALINLQGEMIGLTTNIATIAGHEEPARYAIPLNSSFKRIIDTLKQGEEVEYGLLGVGLGAPLLGRGEQPMVGVVVQDVLAGGPAQHAGLLARDQITHVDGQPVDSPQSLQLLVGAMPPAKATEVQFVRGNSAKHTTVHLSKYPQPGRIVFTKHPPAWRGIRVDYASMQEVVKKTKYAVTTAPDSKGCVIIREVEPQSSSWKAGIRPGMFISHVGDQRVASPAEFYTAVADASGAIGVRLTQPLLNGQETSENGDENEQVNL